MEQPDQCGSRSESEYDAMGDSELIASEQDCESGPIPGCKGDTDEGGIEEDFTAPEEEDAPCLPSGTGEIDPAGGRSPVKKLKRDVVCDPSLARSKYSLRARVKPPARWSKLGAS